MTHMYETILTTYDILPLPLQALLKTMQPKYKLALVEKLCEDVLGSAAEGGLPLDGCCQGVIADALGVVALPDLQISAKGVVNTEEDGGDDGGDAGGGTQVRSSSAPRYACMYMHISSIHAFACMHTENTRTVMPLLLQSTSVSVASNMSRRNL